MAIAINLIIFHGYTEVVLLLLLTACSCPVCWNSKEEHEEGFIVIEKPPSGVCTQKLRCVTQTRLFTRDVLIRLTGAA